MPKPTGTWRVLKVPRHQDPLFPYHVITPDGGLSTIAATLWGARWHVRREKAKRAQRNHVDWWEAPTVHEENGDA